MKPTVVSTFAGGGGSSLGYQLAGYDELLAIDYDDHAEETFKLNFPDVPFWNRDITGVTAREILMATGLKVKELDVLDGSPPCQGFSTSGRQEVNDERNMLFQDYARLLSGLKPKVFVMENVPGMVRGKLKGIFLEVLKELESQGYKVACKKLNAANYGVPQYRERLFFIGIRKDLVKEFEDWTTIYPTPSPGHITVGQALEGVENTAEEIEWATNILKSPKSQEMLSKLRQGQDGGDYHPKGHWFSFIRLHNLRTSKTMTKVVMGGGSCLIHPTEPRAITISEAKRLCSFPDDFKLTGKFKQQWARLGNAVMPLQMKAIAESIRINFLDKIGGKK